MRSFFAFFMLFMVAAQVSVAAVSGTSTRSSLWESLEPAFGYGSNGLNLTLERKSGSDVAFYTTNSGYYFFSIGIDRFSFQAKFPSRDREEVRIEKGDSKVTDYQMAFEITEKFQFEAFYQKYHGYYTETLKRTYILPEVASSHLGGQVTYVYDPKYSLSILQSSIWNQKVKAGSPFFSFGFHEFELNGDLAPQSLMTGLRPNLESVKATAISAKAGYGYTWIWKNWFAGAGGAYGATASQIRYRYKEADEEKTTDLQTGFSIGLAGGYQWTKTKLGLFTRSYNWGMKFDDKKIASNSTMTGLYVSSFF